MASVRYCGGGDDVLYMFGSIRVRIDRSKDQ